MRTLLAVAGLLAAMAASGQVYRWTDSTGKVHYGDRPPDEAKARELRIQSYDGPVEVQDWSGVLRGKTVAGSGPGLTICATSWCGYCKRARAYFAQKNIRYTEVDVEKSPEGKQRFKELRQGRAPDRDGQQGDAGLLRGALRGDGEQAMMRAARWLRP